MVFKFEILLRSDNWKKVPQKEREKMGLNFENDGEFWWAKIILLKKKIKYLLE